MAFLLGLAAALAVVRANGWWLDSAAGVAMTMAVLFGVGFVVSRWRAAGRRERAIAAWAGSVLGHTVQLAARGPGTIWPIVLVVGAVLVAVAVLAGTAAASLRE